MTPTLRHDDHKQIARDFMGQKEIGHGIPLWLREKLRDAIADRSLKRPDGYNWRCHRYANEVLSDLGIAERAGTIDHDGKEYFVTEPYGIDYDKLQHACRVLRMKCWVSPASLRCPGRSFHLWFRPADENDEPTITIGDWLKW